MQKHLKIYVSKKPVDDAVINCRTLNVKKKLFNKLFGENAKMTIIVPGVSVKTIEITEKEGGGVIDGQV